jgi:hypothetical protein
LYAGDFDQWQEGITRQATERPEASLYNSLRELLKIDPVLIILGSISFVYAAVRKDPVILLWIIPFMIFFYFVGHVTYNYWVILLPAFCIAGSVFIIELGDKIMRRASKSLGRVLPFAVVSSIVIFALVVDVMLISADLTSAQIQAAAFVQYQLNSEKAINDNSMLESSNITVISGPNYSWIFKYVFKEANILENFRDRSPVDTEKYIIMTDPPYKTFLRRDQSDRSERLEALHDDTISIAKFKGNASNYDFDRYPYFSISQGRAGSQVDVRGNY